ncbi:MAG: nucleotidyltransferase domain-containing protein [Eubacteriales bacterium]|nr:nucleotidyltransferase domain-containing protein [Eubacteriales bacterium]
MNAELFNIIIRIVDSVADEFSFCSIYLFGSYYKGTYNSESDVDLAFFLTDEYDINNALRRLLSVCGKEEYDIQPQVFSAQEIENKMGIVEEILDNGMEIYCRGTWSRRWMV